jgi:2-methylisocitrate lyase-like PEP mutase family enzyme
MVTNAAMIVECTQLPVIADADTGYGNPLNVIRTVREYERANVAAIHIEDQIFPKRCGHLTGKQVIPSEQFVQKIKAAVDNRRNPDFLIIARTDAIAVHGFEEAINRANLCAEAGADIIFVEAPRTIEQLREIPRKVKGPCLVNMPGPASKTPAATTSELQNMGYKIVIYPSICFEAAIRAIRQVLSASKEKGIGWDSSFFLSPEEFFTMVGLEKWGTWERKYSTMG